MGAGVQRNIVGAFYGTGADLTVRTIGFRPKKVEVYNVSGLCRAVWMDGMADDSAIKVVTDGTMSLVTSNGITPLSDGFGFGADTDLNVSGELARWVAYE